MPRHPEDVLPGPLEQRVVDRDRERRIRREHLGHDQIGQGQSERVARPAGVGEQSVCAAVMPHLLQSGAKGVVAERAGLPMDVAFDRLRRYARNSNQKLSEVARRLVERDLDPDLVLTATQALWPPARGHRDSDR
jgi:hypothetical protein